MCEYCKEGRKQLNDDIGVDNEIKRNYKGGFILEIGESTYDNYFTYEIEINYCPMCGRKLSE